MSTTNPQNIDLKCSLLSLLDPTLNFNLFLCTFFSQLKALGRSLHLLDKQTQDYHFPLFCFARMPGVPQQRWILRGGPPTHEVKRKEGRNYTVEIELGQSQAKDMGQGINPS